MTSVYVMTALPLPHVKIGFAKNPESRRARLQTGAPYKLAVAYSVPVTEPAQIEVAIHRHFAKHRTQGEWFAVEVAAAIEAIEAAIRGELPLQKQARVAGPFLSPPGVCPHCDRRRAAKAAAMRTFRANTSKKRKASSHVEDGTGP
jgi:hypothetical protein